MLRRGRDLAEGMYWGAPVIIFCIGTAAHAAQECAMVCQNMMLAATALGLGSCCVGFGARVTDDQEIVEALELKENEKIYGPIVVGYPEIVPEPPPKKPPVVKWV
jgi:nitroreductase